MSKRTEELEQEDFLYALYDTKSKTFLRKLSWLGFASGHIKIYGPMSLSKAKSERTSIMNLKPELGAHVKIVKLGIVEEVA